MSIRRLNTQQPDFAAKFSELVAVDSSVDPEITRRAEAIVQDVRARGDEASLSTPIVSTIWTPRALPNSV